MDDRDRILLQEVASYFSRRSEYALELLTAHYRPPRVEKDESKPSMIVLEDGTEISVVDFCDRHRLAYKRRIENRVPDEIRLLEMELLGNSGRCGIGGGTPPAGPSLDYYDNRIDPESQYKGRYGRYPRRS